MPGQTPDLGARRAVSHARVPKVLDARRARHRQPDQGQVLHVLRHRERTRLKNEHAMAALLVAREDVLREGGAEATPADHDHVERARVSADALIGAGKRLIETVADVAAEHVTREIGRLRRRTRHDLTSKKTRENKGNAEQPQAGQNLERRKCRSNKGRPNTCPSSAASDTVNATNAGKSTSPRGSRDAAQASPARVGPIVSAAPHP